MPKFVYCSVCGTKMTVTRKAVRKLGRIVELIDPHKCHEEPIDLDLNPVEVPSYVEEGNKKFVQNLNKLVSLSTVSTSNLRDRRFDVEQEEEASSTAPQSLIQNLRSMQHSPPARPIPEGNSFEVEGEEDEM